ncbi:hypothetical protein [Gilvibacter sp.]|uniref:hypothetical protein n=1 Tax=Gilvibacter sp. TaxID=2729997 RepID=UPI0025BD5F7A|nr:hypothetical protein [Gilvibacter sp.]NQX76216.1 hypothetical protein [Gilvibacter sp.]
MKKLIFIGALLAGFLTSCSTETVDENLTLDNNASFSVSSKTVLNAGTATGTTTPEICSVAYIMAGQDTIAGKLFILADSDNIYVTYTTISNWVIDETHLFIGHRDDIPVNGSGNPRIGHFPYSASHYNDTNEVVYTIPKSAVPDCFTLAAHSVVSKIDSNGNTVVTETAWTEGTKIGGSNWAMATDYCISGCPTSPDNGPIRRR